MFNLRYSLSAHAMSLEELGEGMVCSGGSPPFMLFRYFFRRLLFLLFCCFNPFIPLLSKDINSLVNLIDNLFVPDCFNETLTFSFSLSFSLSFSRFALSLSLLALLVFAKIMERVTGNFILVPRRAITLSLTLSSLGTTHL